MYEYGHARKHSRLGTNKVFARGGAVHADADQDRKLVKSMLDKRDRDEAPVPGEKASTRLDKRARGGRIRKHTTVNVIVPQRREGTGPVPAVGPPISSVLPTGGPSLPSVPTPGPTGRPIPPPTFKRGGRVGRQFGGEVEPSIKGMKSVKGLATGGRVKVETGEPIENHGEDQPYPKPASYDEWIDKAKQKSPRKDGGRVGYKYGGGIPHNGESKSKTAEAHRLGHNKSGYASGGRVHTYPKMTTGADSGEGRLEAIRKYGFKARQKTT